MVVELRLDIVLPEPGPDGMNDVLGCESSSAGYNRLQGSDGSHFIQLFLDCTATSHVDHPPEPGTKGKGGFSIKNESIHLELGDVPLMSRTTVFPMVIWGSDATAASIWVLPSS